MIEPDDAVAKTADLIDVVGDEQNGGSVAHHIHHARVALLLEGGVADGKDFIKAAIACGADTYVSGRLSYNTMEEASEMGINLIEAGHYFTEAPVTNFFADLVGSIDGNAYIEILDSNMIKTF